MNLNIVIKTLEKKCFFLYNNNVKVDDDMNKKGFTLVELLAVIVILALLALVANSSVTNVVRNSKSDLYNAQLELIESAAKTWGAENLDKLPEDGKCSYITLKNLKKYGLLEGDVVNPKTNKNFSDNMYIKITSKVNSEGFLKTDYEVDANNVSSCIEIYPTICTLVSGEENTIGSKYECEVKTETKYNFYVLSHNNDGSTNLIMDRNMCSDGTPTDASKEDKCMISWNSTGSNFDGPVLALDYLYNATMSWINIPNIVMNYTDEGNTGANGYGSIVTTDNITILTKKDGTQVLVLNDQIGYTNLKARLPYLSEIDSSNGANEYSYENLDNSNWSGSETKPINNISGIYGYWTFLSEVDTSTRVWAVLSDGIRDVREITTYLGVRPVITLEL